MFNIPIFALVLWALYGRARRRYVDHLIAATHFYAFLLLAVIIVNLIVVGTYSMARVVLLRGAFWTGEGFYSALILLPILFYLYGASRRLHRRASPETALKTVLALPMVIVVLQIYRYLLFFLVFYSV